MKPWEQAAIRELLDVVYILSNGGFETKRDLLNRLALSREGIDLLEVDDIPPRIGENVTFLQPRILERGNDDVK